MGKGYLSYSATAILQAVASGYRYGFDIMDITGLPSGAVYPALRRREETGLVISKWEKAGVALRGGRVISVGGIAAIRQSRGWP